jgi:hypothetical protein
MKASLIVRLVCMFLKKKKLEKIKIGLAEDMNAVGQWNLYKKLAFGEMDVYNTR